MKQNFFLQIHCHHTCAHRPLPLPLSYPLPASLSPTGGGNGGGWLVVQSREKVELWFGWRWSYFGFVGVKKEKIKFQILKKENEVKEEIFMVYSHKWAKLGPSIDSPKLGSFYCRSLVNDEESKEVTIFWVLKSFWACPLWAHSSTPRPHNKGPVWIIFFKKKYLYVLVFEDFSRFL